MDIPDELKSWETVVISANRGNKQMLPFCLRCGCPKIDEFPKVCWGCGKDTLRYEGAMPTPIISSGYTEVEAANEIINVLIR